MMRYSTTFVNEKMSFEHVYKYQIISASPALWRPTNITAVTRFENDALVSDICFCARMFQIRRLSHSLLPIPRAEIHP
jgi:hypothetical protein